jgi:hypothetical protein
MADSVALDTYLPSALIFVSINCIFYDNAPLLKV